MRNMLEKQLPLLNARYRRVSKNFERNMFILPGVAVLFILTIVPTFYGLWISLNEVNQGAGAKSKFVGLQNYLYVIKRAEFLNSVFLTAIYVTLTISLTVVLGFLLALALKKDFYGKKAVMGLFILPVVFTPVVSGLIWKFMFMADLGIINYFLSFFGIRNINWLASGVNAFIAVLIVDVWQWTPFCMFFLLAGLQNIPVALSEACYIDGANKLQVLIHIITPQLLPVSSVVVLFRLMDAFKLFDQIYVMTQGGPGRATQTINLLAYFLGFRYFNYGMAAALGILLLIVIVVICKLIINFFSRIQESM